jgi:hypothetical protein
MNICLHVTIANIIAFIQEFGTLLVTSIEYKSLYKAYFIFGNYFANTCRFVRWKALILFIYMYVMFSVRPSRPSKQTGFVFFGRGMLYSDMAWSRSSDMYIGVIYLHMVLVFYFISPETVPFRCHFVLYMIYLSLCM